MKKIIAVFIFAAALSAARAQTNATPARVLSLTECLTEALKHNFDVQVSRYDPQINLYQLYANYGGWDPAFTVSGQHNYNSIPGGFNQYSTNAIPSRTTEADSFNAGINGTLPEGLQYNITGNIADTTSSTDPENTGGQIGIQLTQPLLKNFWIDNTRLQISIAKNTLKQSQQGLRAQLISTVVAIETAYYELIYSQEYLKVQQEALQLAQTQLDQDKQRMQIGTLAQLSVQLDESQVAKNKAAVISAAYTVASNQNTLKNLLTDNYKSWHDTDITPSESLTATRQLFDLQDSWSKGMTERPDLLQAQLTLEQQGIQLKFYRNQLYPELDLTGSYGYNGSGQEYSDVFRQYADQNSPFWSYGAQMSIPLSNVAARNNVKAGKVTEQQDLLKLKQIEQNILVQIDDAVKKAQSAWESVQATKEARIYAEAALDAEQKTYAVGKATTFEVLQAQNTLTSARSDEIRSLADYAEALSALAQQEGSTLQRRGLDIEVNDGKT
ncbi:MAG TPA: TolC family protein [Verrucomicrobiae bacterium]|jgi:outer membrane protein TolC